MIENDSCWWNGEDDVVSVWSMVSFIRWVVRRGGVEVRVVREMDECRETLMEGENDVSLCACMGRGRWGV
ncbi:hypothetical protein, partial [Paenibacillus xylanexedens]|uniref:hypothetical protein n=1 Tax=Paenibacillus xylanexedens TaxID=528191 RepID=UPI001C930C9E